MEKNRSEVEMKTGQEIGTIVDLSEPLPVLINMSISSSPGKIWIIPKETFSGIEMLQITLQVCFKII